MPDDVMTSHNEPDNLTTAEALRLNLEDRHGDILKRRDDLVAAFDRVPESIDNDEVEQKATDFIKQCKMASKNTNAARVAEKEVFLEGGRTVDGYFKAISADLDGVAGKANALVTTYKQAKAKAEREAREQAEREAREAEAEAKRLAEEAEANIQDEGDLENAVEADEARVAAKNAAAEAKQNAEAKAADLSRSRSDAGTVSSLTTRWVHAEDSLNRDALDLEALRQHLPALALHQAVRGFVKAGGRELPGVRIYEKTENVVR